MPGIPDGRFALIAAGTLVTVRLASSSTFETRSSRLTSIRRSFLVASTKQAARVLGKLQGIPLYRFLGRRLAGGYQIEEASEDELRTALTWFNLADADLPVRRNPRVTNLVAKRRGKLLGFVQLVPGAVGSHEALSYWLCGLLVKVRHRGTGVGEAMCRAVALRAKQRQVKYLLLFVSQDNRRAIDLYHKLGYERHIIPSLEDRLESECSRTGGRRILMRKDLEHNGH